MRHLPTISDLRTEYRSAPLGIDEPRPHLSWVIDSLRRGLRQHACQVLVASSRAVLASGHGDLWDSGKILRDDSAHLVYAGAPLSSNQGCWWKVRVWMRRAGEGEKEEIASEWSEPAAWTTGLMSPGDWKASWIAFGAKPAADSPVANVPADAGRRIESPSPWLRTSFDLDAAAERAIVHVNAIGYFELYVNGEKVGADVLNPAVSVLKRRSFVMTYDISRLLRGGRNTLGLWLGRGWNVAGRPTATDERPRARLQCHVTAGGNDSLIVTDATWRASASPFTTLGPWAWNQFGGERFDARKDDPDWCRPDFNDSGWQAVVEVPHPDFATEAMRCPPNRIGETIPAVSCVDLGGGRYELDFGRALSGRVRMTMPALASGDLVKLWYADWRYRTARPEDEMTQAGIVKSSCSDMLFTGKDGAVRYQVFNQCDEFISAGRNGQAFCSKFNYHGFRYVIVEGLKENPGTSCAVAELIESDLESTGSFACSNERFNRIHALNQWTLRCLNLGGYLVDCPHRERLGYGDGQVSIESCLLNSNMHGLYAKWMRDWIDTQDTSSGALPFSTPYHPTGSEVGFGLEGPPGWGGTMPVLAWKIFLHYGDERVLSEAFQPMLAFMNRMESHCVDGILRGYGDQWQQLGDWVPPDRGMDGQNWPSRPANELFNNCYRVYLWDLMEKMSRALGRADEAERCRAKIAEMRPLIHREFYDDHAGLYVCDEQAYQVMPLLAGIVPSDLRPRLLQRLEEGIILRRKGHLDTGMLGTYFMMQFLSGIERDDLLYTIVNQETYPGWDYMLSQGATTMWEQWNGYWSRIHSCYTSPSGWFQGGLAGLQADPSAPGMRRFIVRPAPVGDLSWVSSTHQSLYGRIACDWRLQSGWFILNLRIPVNTTALVHLPSEANGDVFEGGMPVEGADGVRGVGSSAGRRIFEVEGGSYRFEVRWRK